MERLKKVFKYVKEKIWSIKKYRYLLIGLVLVFFFVFYFLISFLRVSPVAVALVELERTFAPEIICHEKCALYRQKREQVIVFGLKKGGKRAKKAFAGVWQKEISPKFREELVKLAAISYGEDNPPNYIIAYLSSAEANLEVLREIVSRFPYLANYNSDLKNVLAARLNDLEKPEERLEVLKVLREINNDREIEAYFSILDSDEDLEYRRQALKNISDTKDKLSYFSLNQLAVVRDLVLDLGTPLSLRRELVLLIGDYYLVFPKESALLWQEVYEEDSLDNISRLFAVDSLNHLEKTNFSLPKVSSLEWDLYYNN